jgi:hypothetical protein
VKFRGERVGQSCFRAGAGKTLQRLEWDNGCGTYVQGGQHLMEIGVGQQQFGGWGVWGWYWSKQR